MKGKIGAGYCIACARGMTRRRARPHPFLSVPQQPLHRPSKSSSTFAHRAKLPMVGPSFLGDIIKMFVLHVSRLLLDEGKNAYASWALPMVMVNPLRDGAGQLCAGKPQIVGAGSSDGVEIESSIPAIQACLEGWSSCQCYAPQSECLVPPVSSLHSIPLPCDTRTQRI